MFDSTVGSLFGGRFRYVRLRAGDTASPAMQVGQVVFWDTTITNWQAKYQVTRDADLSSADNAIMIAGIFLGTLAQGNYGFIQDLGDCPIQFRGTLTVAGTIGAPVFVSDSAAIATDEGLGDIVTTDATAVVDQRYLGVAVAAPSNGSLTRVMLNFNNALAHA